MGVVCINYWIILSAKLHGHKSELQGRVHGEVVDVDVKERKSKRKVT